MIFDTPLKPVENPSIGDKVYIADYTEAKGYRLETWSGTPYQVAYLRENLIYSTKKEALAVTRVVLLYFHGEALYSYCIKSEPKEGEIVYVPQLGKACGFLSLPYRRKNRHLIHARRNDFLFQYDTQASHYCAQALKEIKEDLNETIEATKESEKYKYYTVMPAKGTRVYVPAPRNPEGYIEFDFEIFGEFDSEFLSMGLCFRTARDAKRVSSAVKSRAKHVK